VTETDSLNAFFERKGAVELICVLEVRDGKRHKELLETVNVSAPTLSQRLEESMELNPIERMPTSTKEDESTPISAEYQLTTFGKVMYNWMNDIGVPQTYETLLEIQRRYEEQRDEFIEKSKIWDETVGEYPSGRRGLEEISSSVGSSLPRDHTFTPEDVANIFTPEYVQTRFDSS
jgi:DNA-binding HxlR family transcriptional regulator